MHGQILGQGLEILRLGDEIGFAVQLNHDADLPPHMDIRGNRTVLCRLGGTLCGGRHPFFPEIIDGLFKIAFCGGERFLAVHHAGARLDP